MNVDILTNFVLQTYNEEEQDKANNLVLLKYGGQQLGYTGEYIHISG
jgi:hypothetical protein